MPPFCFWELEFRFSRLQGAHFTSWTTFPVPFLAVFNQTPLQSARVLRMLPSSCWGATTARPLSHLPGYCHRCCLSTGICDKAPCTWLTSSSFPALVTLCPDSIPFHHRCSSWYTWALTFHPGLCFPCVFSLTTHQLIHSWGVSLPPPLVLTSLTQGFLSIHPMDHLLPHHSWDIGSCLKQKPAWFSSDSISFLWGHWGSSTLVPGTEILLPPASWHKIPLSTKERKRRKREGSQLSLRQIPPICCVSSHFLSQSSFLQATTLLQTNFALNICHE